jgi:hypothetical protein
MSERMKAMMAEPAGLERTIPLLFRVHCRVCKRGSDSQPGGWQKVAASLEDPSKRRAVLSGFKIITASHAISAPSAVNRHPGS